MSTTTFRIVHTGSLSHDQMRALLSAVGANIITEKEPATSFRIVHTGSLSHDQMRAVLCAIGSNFNIEPDAAFRSKLMQGEDLFEMAGRQMPPDRIGGFSNTWFNGK